MINNSYLLGMYGLTPTTTGSSGAGSTAKKQPTAPWSTSVKPQTQSDLLRAALSGRRFINEATTSLDVQGASSGDYRKIFAMYQGLSLLEAITDRAGQRGVSALENAQLSKRFDAGMAELSAFLKDSSFEGLRMVEGVSATKAQTGAGVARDSAKYVTGAIHTGAFTDEVAAFQGDVKFNITVKSVAGVQSVAIDLADMGSDPRTLQSVVAHINGKLEAAGVQTRMSRELLPSEPRVIKTGDKTITLPAGADRWALSVQGVTAETVSFVPVTSADAVYVVQGVGTAGSHNVLKFQEGASKTEAAFSVDGQVGQSNLPEGVKAVRASAVGPDGAMWIVADVNEGSSTQPIKGQGDVVLMKLDSAGQVVLSRALGAASTASGYAISVSDDGRVAVAGSVIGALEPGAAGADANKADSFVTVFDAKGVEQWTQRRGAKAADEATAVSFGADGRVYVAGRSQSAMPGGVVSGGWDGYVQAFSESQVHSLAPVMATASGLTQFGTTGDDSVQAMTVDGDKLYTAGIENGRMVVRRFQIDATGAPTLLSTRDLGGAGSGEISGLSVSNGQVVLAGATRNQALDIGQVNNAHAGGFDAFVAVISDDLTASGADRLTYFGGAGDDSAADVKIVDGKVWLTGVSDRAIGAKAEDPTSGYLARLDPLTGAVEWKQTWTGANGQAAPMTIAVAAGGASVLDRLGLPQGEIAHSDSKRLVDATALRAGDRFYVTSSSGRSVAVTIDAKETLQSLARKIETASGRSLRVTIKTDKEYTTGLDGDAKVTAGGVQRLSIAYADGRDGAVLRAGEAGRDALAALGLTPGYIGPTSSDLKTFGLDLPKTMNLRDADAVKRANDKLAAAIVTLRSAYRALAPKSTTPAITGEAPAYLKAQLANYQAALARLTG